MAADEREVTLCILTNQAELLSAVSLLIRLVKPDLVGNAGEIDRYRDDLLLRFKATCELIGKVKP